MRPYSPRQRRDQKVGQRIDWQVEQIVALPIHVLGHYIERDAHLRFGKNCAEHAFEVCKHFVEGQAPLFGEHAVHHDIIARRDGFRLLQDVRTNVAIERKLLPREFYELWRKIQTRVLNSRDTAGNHVLVEV